MSVEDLRDDRDRLQRALEAAERWMKSCPHSPPIALLEQIEDALTRPPDSAPDRTLDVECRTCGHRPQHVGRDSSTGKTYVVCPACETAREADEGEVSP